MLARPEIDKEFSILSANLKSSRIEGIERDIAEFITAFDVFESMDKPYVTAQLLMLDTDNILEDMDFQGGETIDFRMQNMMLTEAMHIVEKTFVISKLIRSRKTNQNVEVYNLHLIERHAFKSDLVNVNKAYRGSPSNIISEILEGFLEKEVWVSDDEFQDNIKLIVPNMHPLEGCQWIKDHTTNKDGFPFYFFSTFNTNFLYLISLGFMLGNKPQNKDNPFVYSQQGMNFSFTNQQKMYGVQNYSHVDNDDLPNLIRSGDIASEYIFHNTANNISKIINHNVIEDLVTLTDDYLPTPANSVTYGVGLNMDGKQLEEYQSRKIFKVCSTGAYDDGDGKGYKSLGEETQRDSYKKQSSAKALKNLSLKNPISIQVDGKHFLNGDDNYTLGQTIRVIFLSSSPAGHGAGSTDTLIDNKKSGDYLIYATRHMFKDERYDIKLFCIKLAHYTSQDLGSYLKVGSA